MRLPYGTVFIHVHMRTSMGLVWSVEIQIAPAGRNTYISIWLRESGSGCGRAGSLFGRPQWISMGETSGRIDDESLPLTGALGQLMATCMMPVYGKPYLINTRL